MRDLRVPYVIGDHTITVSASIGIASARDAGLSAQEVVRNADVAMYMAKANGKAGLRDLRPRHARGHPRPPRARAPSSSSAVDLDQLRLVYQPIVSLEIGPRRRPRGPGALAASRSAGWSRRASSSRSPRRTAPSCPSVAGSCARPASGPWPGRREGLTPPEPLPVRQRLGARDPAAGLRRRGRGGARLGRPGADPPHPRDHRDRADQGDHRDGGDPRGAAVARRPGRHRRLRHRLLLAQPPAPVPGRRAEDRQRVRPGRRATTRARRRWPARSWRSASRSTSPPWPRASRPRSRRSGCASLGMQLRPGLLLRQADDRRRDRGRRRGPGVAAGLASRRIGARPSAGAATCDRSRAGSRARPDARHRLAFGAPMSTDRLPTQAGRLPRLVRRGREAGRDGRARPGQGLDDHQAPRLRHLGAHAARARRPDSRRPATRTCTSRC